ncbi:MAG TPA: hypothetical protein VGK67_11795 [Myxococcales bacterium]|jgi:hypothetical protein
MKGSIQGRHVLRHSVTIVREFGPLCLLRCLKALLLRERTTFLNVAFHK